MQAFVTYSVMTCALLLGVPESAAAFEPYTPGIPVAPGSALAERAIKLSLPEFKKLDVVHTENYEATIRQDDMSLSVVFVDQTDCQSESDGGSLRHPIVFVMLDRDATLVASSHVNRIAVCPRS